MLSDKDRPAFVQVFRHPHPPRMSKPRTSASAAGTTATSSRPSQGDNNGADPASKPGVVAAAAAVERCTSAAVDSIEGRRGVTACLEGTFGLLDGAERRVFGVAGNDSKAEEATTTPPTTVVRAEDEGGFEREGRGGSASIFGVAFDDYIGEEGVLHPPTPAVTVGAAAAAAAGDVGGGGSRFERVENDGTGAGEARASTEEDRRWDYLNCSFGNPTPLLPQMCRVPNEQYIMYITYNANISGLICVAEK